MLTLPHPEIVRIFRLTEHIYSQAVYITDIHTMHSTVTQNQRKCSIWLCAYGRASSPVHDSAYIHEVYINGRASSPVHDSAYIHEVYINGRASSPVHDSAYIHEVYINGRASSPVHDSFPR